MTYEEREMALVTPAEMAREYSFTDIDGTQPDSWADVSD